jgi:hypothetical protein
LNKRHLAASCEDRRGSMALVRAKERLALLLRQGRIEVDGGAHPALVRVIDGPHLTVSLHLR